MKQTGDEDKISCNVSKNKQKQQELYYLIIYENWEIYFCVTVHYMIPLWLMFIGLWKVYTPRWSNQKDIRGSGVKHRCLSLTLTFALSLLCKGYKLSFFVVSNKSYLKLKMQIE